MRKQGYGRILNTCSAAGLLGAERMSNYGAAKTGLVGLTRVLAAEGAEHNIKVNAIAPIAHTRMLAHSVESAAHPTISMRSATRSVTPFQEGLPTRWPHCSRRSRRTNRTDGYRWLAAYPAACAVIPFAGYDVCAKLGSPPGSPLQMVSPSAHKSSVFGAYSGPMAISGAP
jgi:NAD(P)-dependent dehydrogenase (short-subunit alcohol dehydrogenase family)